MSSKTNLPSGPRYSGPHSGWPSGGRTRSSLLTSRSGILAPSGVGAGQQGQGQAAAGPGLALLGQGPPAQPAAVAGHALGSLHAVLGGADAHPVGPGQGAAAQ